MFARSFRGLARHWPHFLVMTLMALLVASGLHGWLRERLLDARFDLVQRAPTGHIVLVQIDSRSIDEMGAWPWPRSVHAALLRKLRAAGAGDVAFDVDFSAPSTPASDSDFAAALQDHGGSVILASFRQRAGAGGVHENRPIPVLAEAAWPGVVNVAPDADGTIRRYETAARVRSQWQPSLGALLSGQVIADGAAFRIDYGVRQRDLPRVSYIDVLRDEPAAIATVRGRKAIVSGTAIELGDRFVTPGGTILPGSVIQALATESILQGRMLSSTSRLPTLLGLALMAGVLVAAWRLRPLWRCAIVFAIAALAEAAAIGLQTWRPVALDTSLLLAACPAYAMAIGLDHFDLQTRLRAAAERRFHRVATSLSDGLACLDDHGRVTFWNPGAAAIFGHQQDDMLDARFAALFAPETPFADDAHLRAALNEAAGQVIETKGRRKDGDIFDLEASFSKWRALGRLNFGVVLRDISRRKQDEARILYLATFDPLTGAANRHSLLSHLETAAAQDGSGAQAGLVLVSINQFEQTSNLQGRNTGDALLRVTADRLAELIDPDAFLARLDGPDFAILVPPSPQGGRALVFADRLAGEMERQPVHLDAQRVSVSVALALPHATGGAEEWLGDAQLALAKARTLAATKAVRYRSSMRQDITLRAGLEAELRRALERREFELFYQPQVDLASRKIVGAEALIRWNHPQRGLLSPSEFMPVVNTTSLARGVSDWVLEAAIRQAADWSRQGREIRVGVNLCQAQLGSRSLAAKIARLIETTGAPPHLLDFEVTEDIILDRDGRAKVSLANIRALGASVAFDDFGTGYGSLSYLKSYPIDRIKIDQSFVRSLRPDAQDAAIVQAVLDLGRAFRLSTIAEGIEDEETARLLTAMGCAEGQGYLFGRPMSTSRLQAMLPARETCA